MSDNEGLVRRFMELDKRPPSAFVVRKYRLGLMAEDLDEYELAIMVPDPVKAGWHYMVKVFPDLSHCINRDLVQLAAYDGYYLVREDEDNESHREARRGFLKHGIQNAMRQAEDRVGVLADNLKRL